MPRKPPPPVTIGMDRAQKMSAAAPMATDGIRLAGARLAPIDQIAPDPDQPRRDWDAEEASGGLAELAASLKEFGVLQPLLVREQGALDDGRARYVIIAGGRRRAAAERAGLATLPVVIRDEEAGRVRVLQLVENLQRQDLSPLDEARGYQELMETEDLTPEAVARRLHVSGQRVRERLRLLADQVLADAVERGQISATVARDIMRLPDDEIACVRVRVLAGERLQSNDIAAARARLDAAGVTNPRRKGGGRPAAAAPARPTVADPALGPAPPVAEDRASLDHAAFSDAETGGVDAADQASLDRDSPTTLVGVGVSLTDQATLDPPGAAGRDSGPPLAVPDSTGPAAQVRDDASAPGEGTGDSDGAKMGDAAFLAAQLLHGLRDVPRPLRDMDETLTYRRGDPQWQRLFVEILHLRIKHLLGEDVNTPPGRPEIARS